MTYERILCKRYIIIIFNKLTKAVADLEGVSGARPSLNVAIYIGNLPNVQQHITAHNGFSGSATIKHP